MKTKNLDMSPLKMFFIIAISADPNEMPHCVAFHLGLHRLPKYRLSSGPIFPNVPTFLSFLYLLLLFLENALLSLLFYSKMSFTRKNPETFLARLDFRNQSCFSSGWPPLKHIRNLFLTLKSLSV